ncbi:MAG: hypothetical protein ACT4PT_11465 [Methanobacteriota archaeon]
MSEPRAPPAEAAPEDVARYLLKLLEVLGLQGVLVGTTAALAAGDIQVRSKDTDVVAVGVRRPAALRKALREHAAHEGLVHDEPGWGVVSLSRPTPGGDPDAVPAWTGDVILPSSGMIPPAAARLVARDAVETDWGPAACAEHVVAMKAVAAADRAAEGQPLLVMKYEQHIELMAQRHGADLDWDRVRELLGTYSPKRREGAASLLRDAFGVDPLDEGGEP